MSKDFSYKRAGKWAVTGLGAATLAGVFQAVAHHAARHFDTLGAAFAYVAQPKTVLAAVALSAAFGAFMEFRNLHNQKVRDVETLKSKPDRRPPQQNP